MSACINTDIPKLEKSVNTEIDTTELDSEFSRKISHLEFQKMTFLYNALEDGWQICKNLEKYIFIKKHEGKKEVFLDSYLQEFINKNMDISKIL